MCQPSAAHQNGKPVVGIVYSSFNMISPWMVGRIGSAADSDSFYKTAASLSGVPVGSGLLALNEGGQACSTDFYLRITNDGGRMLKGEIALWASNTVGSGADEAILQGDGNFVLYTSSGTPVWASNTAGNTGAYLSVQNDGNVVVYSASGAALWSTGTAGK
jgi:hypothetical protein